MGHEEQAEVPAVQFPEPPVIQRGNNGFTGAGGCDDEVAVPIMQLSFGLELFEHLGLVGLGLHFQSGQCDDNPLVGLLPRGDIEGFAESVAVLGWAVGLELPVFPVGLEGSAELVQQVWRRDRRQADVPLQAVDERSVGEVARADVGGVEPGVAMQHPGLGVQPGPVDLVVDPDLCAEIVD